MFSRTPSFGIFVLSILFSGGARAQFGASISDEVADERFRNVGQAYVKKFEIVDDETKFTVVLEDTVGEKEYWVVDFEPYNMNTSKLAVEESTGDIIPANTGECSSVIGEGGFDHIAFGPGYYFSDLGNFEEMNISRDEILNADQNGLKRLFTHYRRGQTYSDNDIRGEELQRQDYTLAFDGNFGFFFNCTNSHSQSIWEFSNTTQTVEFRTTIHFTNVRPVDPLDGSEGSSWVSSSAELIYRISRIAIVNFILSSTALVKPVLDYVIIGPYIENVLPIPGKAHVEIHFRTTVESTEGELLAYILDTFEYNSRDNITTLDQVLEGSYGTVQCSFDVLTQCEQKWYFKLVLDVSDHVAEDGVPIDATGTFGFSFQLHNCSDPTGSPPSTCSEKAIDPFFISMEITIQTVVEVLDSEKDSPRIELFSLQGENGDDLRGGTNEGRRGVNHLEEVSMKVRYQPEFLRDDFDLKLMLFMVCKDDKTENVAGCLDVETSQRYIAYYDTEFIYEYTTDGENVTRFNLTDIESEWNPNGNATTQQMLSYHGYDRDTSIYQMDFTNSALSQVRLEYTITTVYELIEANTRRKRSQSIVPQEESELMIYNFHNRERRDIWTAVQESQANTVSLESLGCPDNSVFEDQQCLCVIEGEGYDLNTFSCQPMDTEEVVEQIDEEDSNEEEQAIPSSSPSRMASCVMFLSAILICFLYNN
ncbi:uncharacterized protein [Apostichopus japonicus]